MNCMGALSVTNSSLVQIVPAACSDRQGVAIAPRSMGGCILKLGGLCGLAEN